MFLFFRNKGNDAHSLVACKVAGLEKGNKFKFAMSASESDLNSVSSQTLQSSKPPSSMCDATSCNLTLERSNVVLPLMMSTNCLKTRFCHTPYVTSGYHLNCMTGSGGPFKARLSSTRSSPNNETLTSPIHGLPMGDSNLATFNGHLKPRNVHVYSGSSDLDVNKMEACKSSNADINEAIVIHPGEEVFITVTCEARYFTS